MIIRLKDTLEFEVAKKLIMNKFCCSIILLINVLIDINLEENQDKTKNCCIFATYKLDTISKKISWNFKNILRLPKLSLRVKSVLKFSF